MKRPLAVIGFSYIAALGVAFYLSEWWKCILLLIFILFGTATSIFVKNRHKRNLLIGIAFGLILGIGANIFQYYLFENKALQLYDGKTLEIEAVVTEPPKISGNSYSYVFRTLGENPVTVTYATGAELECDMDDIIRGTFEFSKLENNVRFSSYDYYAPKGIYMSVTSIGEIETEVKSKSFLHKLNKIRDGLKPKLQKYANLDATNLTVGMLVGDSDEVDKSTKQTFKNAGISHMLSISGMHIIIIIGTFLRILDYVGVERKLRSSLGIFASIFYMIFVGSSASISRGVVMFVLFLIGDIIGKETDSLNTLGLAAILVTIGNPYSGAGIGLQLSFLCTLGIILFCDRLYKFLEIKLKQTSDYKEKRKPWEKLPQKLLKAVLSPLAGSISALFVSMPLLLLKFGEFSLVSLFVNVILSPIIFIFMILGLLALILCHIPFLDTINYLLGKLLDFFTGIIMNVAEFFGGFSWSILKINDSIIIIMVTLMVISISWMLIANLKSKKILMAFGISIGILLVYIPMNYLATKDILTIAVLSPGKSDGLILTKNGKSMVVGFDSYRSSAKLTEAYLNGNGINQISLLYTISKTRTAATQTGMILGWFDVDQVGFDVNSSTDLLNKANRENTQILDSKLPRTIDMENGVVLSIYCNDAGGYTIVVDYGLSTSVLVGKKGNLNGVRIKNGRIDNIFIEGEIPTGIERYRIGNVYLKKEVEGMEILYQMSTQIYKNNSNQALEIKLK